LIDLRFLLQGDHQILGNWQLYYEKNSLSIQEQRQVCHIVQHAH
jgi:hypothetical protein